MCPGEYVAMAHGTLLPLPSINIPLYFVLTHRIFFSVTSISIAMKLWALIFENSL